MITTSNIQSTDSTVLMELFAIKEEVEMSRAKVTAISKTLHFVQSIDTNNALIYRLQNDLKQATLHYHALLDSFIGRINNIEGASFDQQTA